MYEANLSWKPLQESLNSMVAQGLVVEINSSDNRDKRTNKIYELTQKGENVARYFYRSKALIDLDELLHITQ